MTDDGNSADHAAIGRDLLAWYRAMGVEDGVGDAPVDWLGRGESGPGHDFRLGESRWETMPVIPTAGPGESEPTQAPSAPRRRPDAVPAGASPTSPPVPPQRQFPTASPDAAVMAARSSARDAATLEELGARLAGFDGCALKATAKNLCFYRGAARARLMIIGEAPGRDEDLSGVPFVGPAGRLLDKMLAAIGLGEADVHITNTVYWRPPGNRTPSPQETQACRPFLERQIELVEPDVIALLGGAAANTMLGVQGGIMRLRGNWKEVEIAGRQVRAMPTLHPAFLLRSPAAKRQAWRDLLAIAEVLDGGQ